MASKVALSSSNELKTILSFFRELGILILYSGDYPDEWVGGWIG